MNRHEYLSEKRLVNDFKSAYSKLMYNKSYIIFEEFKTGWGIPDLVVITYDKNRLKNRIQTFMKDEFLPQVDKTTAYGIAYLSRVENTTVNDLCDFLKMKNINKILITLKKRGLIVLQDDKHITVNNVNGNFIIDSIRIFEVKIKNWKQAVSQARRHLWFTDESYIVLPRFSGVFCEKMMSYCKNADIGLIFQNNQDGYEVLVEPSGSGIYNDNPICWKLNELIVDKLSRCGRKFI